MDMVVIGAKEYMTFGDARRRMDPAFREVSPVHFAGAGIDNMQPLVLRTNKNIPFESCRTGDDTAIGGIFPDSSSHRRHLGNRGCDRTNQ